MLRKEVVGVYHKGMEKISVAVEAQNLNKKPRLCPPFGLSPLHAKDGGSYYFS